MNQLSLNDANPTGFFQCESSCLLWADDPPTAPINRADPQKTAEPVQFNWEWWHDLHYRFKKSCLVWEFNAHDRSLTWSKWASVWKVSILKGSKREDSLATIYVSFYDEYCLISRVFVGHKMPPWEYSGGQLPSECPVVRWSSAESSPGNPIFVGMAEPSGKS